MNRRIVFKGTDHRIAFLLVAVSGILLFRSNLNPSTSHSVFYVDIPPPLETEAGDRDLSRYEYGGHIGNCAAILYGEEDTEKGERCRWELEQARTFIEEHFRNRHPAYVIFDSVSIDGIGPSYIFIEPNESGENWEVRIRRRTIGPYTQFNRNVNTWYFTEAFRRRILSGDSYFEKGTNALVLRSRGEYELAL